MTVVLLLLAAIATISMIGSSVASLSRVTPTDATSRGRWGVLEWDSRRTRRLDAHERRWQTALISARDQSTRWPDLIAEIRQLEAAAELAPEPAPERFDAGWVSRRLDLIDRSLERPSPHDHERPST